MSTLSTLGQALRKTQPHVYSIPVKMHKLVVLWLHHQTNPGSQTEAAQSVWGEVYKQDIGDFPDRSRQIGNLRKKETLDIMKQRFWDFLLS